MALTAFAIDEGPLVLGCLCERLNQPEESRVEYHLNGRPESTPHERYTGSGARAFKGGRFLMREGTLRDDEHEGLEVFAERTLVRMFHGSVQVARDVGGRMESIRSLNVLVLSCVVRAFSLPSTTHCLQTWSTQTCWGKTQSLLIRSSSVPREREAVPLEIVGRAACEWWSVGRGVGASIGAAVGAVGEKGHAG